MYGSVYQEKTEGKRRQEMTEVVRAYVRGRWRTVLDPRRIERGRNRGRWEVKVREFSQPKKGPYREVMRRHVVETIRGVG